MDKFRQLGNSDDYVIGLKDVQAVFRCGQTSAMNRIKAVRRSLNKPESINGRRGAPPITMRQLKDYYGLYPQEKK